MDHPSVELGSIPSSSTTQRRNTGSGSILKDDKRETTNSDTPTVLMKEDSTSEAAAMTVARKKQFAVSTRWEREMEENTRRIEAQRAKGPLCTSCCWFSGNATEDLNPMCCCCAHRIGGMFSLLEKQDGTPVMIVGPCWPFCTFITLPLILVFSGLVLFFIIFDANPGMPWWLALIYIPLVIITLVALFFVSCRDPGLLERVTDEEAGHGGWFWNEQVGSFRPAGAMYCRECKVLIQDYDHLCPWTGTGIGRGNIVAFRVFVVSVNILCYLSIALVSYFLLKGIKA